MDRSTMEEIARTLGIEVDAEMTEADLEDAIRHKRLADLKKKYKDDLVVMAKNLDLEFDPRILKDDLAEMVAEELNRRAADARLDDTKPSTKPAPPEPVVEPQARPQEQPVQPSRGPDRPGQRGARIQGGARQGALGPRRMIGRRLRR